MAFDAHGSRIRALERQLVASGPTVAVITSNSTPEETAAAERLAAEAKARGRESVVVRIGFDRAPRP